MIGEQMNMRVTKAWRAKARRIAKRRGITVSDLLRALVAEEEHRVKHTDLMWER